jgi:DNA polymerase I-like protein with 3'-5' exonuclease and polymerase domains
MKEQEEQLSEQDPIITGKKPRKKKEKKPKAPKVKKTLREIFMERLALIDIEKLKKPWMATKSFRLIDTAEELQRWVDTVMSDPGRCQTHSWASHTGPVIAVDTETDGLDIRVINGKMKTKLAGVCLSADGVEGLYIPVGHESGNNIPATQLAPILQKLFDRCHLVFFNAKFDREVLRLSLGITFRDYPFFEDVQTLTYLDDPKAKVDDKGSGSLQEGLKVLSKVKLGLEQIELEDLVKVKAKVFNVELNKDTQRMVYCPFTWVPTGMALWYAASDAITTWLLWKLFHSERDFSKMLGVHRLDHLLVDTITWIERQRPRVDGERLKDTIDFHASRVKQLTEELGRIAGIENFNPGSTAQITQVLFQDRGMEVIERSEKTNDPSTAIGVLKELHKRYPKDEFLIKLMDFREYAALHPSSMRYDPIDHTIRFYLKQNVVAGGRLAAAGGEFEKDGGCGLNPQAIKKVGGNWWVRGKLLPDQSVAPEVESYPDTSKLDPSCFNRDKQLAPNIHPNNHTATYFGKHYCMIPSCTTCEGRVDSRIDANEIINFRGLIVADPGWSIYVYDFSNIEMRVAANVSSEPLFIKEFLEGTGDFHSLTATALFPEFSDPATPKARKKELRSLAKIINFALLYGGTAYTIMENLNKEGFATTFDEAEELVKRYWDSVPTFAAWCQNKRDVARAKMICRTSTGRIINFESAMKGFKIHIPEKWEKDNFWEWKKLTKREVELTRLELKEDALAIKQAAEAMWANPKTGVRNAQEFNRFLGKAERVALNIPLQGVAGDLMRCALNRIRVWALANPGLEKVFRLHLTVHDEIDFSVKNEFAPYVLPRLNRFMKLRKLHESKKWPVPIETDCEYGQTWDVNYHLTGDDSHKAAGWSGVPGMESYIPPDFAEDVVEKIVYAWSNGGEERVTKWLQQLHPRVQGYLSELNDDPDTVRHYITIMLQLHEFWQIDEDEQDEQTLMQYAEENGLKITDEPLIGGLAGYLDSVPPEDIIEVAEPVAPESEPTAEAEPNPEVPITTLEELHEAVESIVTIATEEIVEEDVFFREPPRKEVAPIIIEEKPWLPMVRNLNKIEQDDFLKQVGFPLGTEEIQFVYEFDKEPVNLPYCMTTTIPEEYLVCS